MARDVIDVSLISVFYYMETTPKGMENHVSI